MFESTFNRQELLKTIQLQFALDWHGIHGFRHWSRVCHLGLIVGKELKTNLLIIELFSYLHDSRRVNEYGDRDHGARGADYAASLNGRLFQLNHDHLNTLCHAIRFHSQGLMHEDATVQSCWDADRLDLGRVGTRPRRRYLSAKGTNYIGYAEQLSSQPIEETSIVEPELEQFLTGSMGSP